MILSTDKSGPFGHAPNSVQKTMTLVLVALLPATLFNIWLFGWPALFMFLFSIASCVGIEALCMWGQGKPIQPVIADGSAVLTGWLMAMSLPPWAPWWIPLIGAICAIWLAKHLYGGLGQNVFNPAMIARVALLVSFPVQMTLFVAPKPLFSDGAPGFAESLSIFFGLVDMDTLSSASAMGFIKTELSRGITVSASMAQTPNLMDTLFGFHPGSFGETSQVLVLAGGLFLLARRVISWHIPVAVLGTILVLGTLFNAINPDRFASGLFHLTAGASMLGAFFIATDYVTSPVSKQGQIVFGIGVGFLTWVIRTFAGYPEGMAFAVLLMNSVTPIIDSKIRPRTFGRTRKGEPLEMTRKP
ncbi:MAG: RnfABCDGE type electron transport complex subunit D [Alphaproteobacteria bacterium]|nr:RnfABCDGE type electron transport complex subunit D [Alphaproteobacteria bacterium]MBF0128632.1 RnfABCDGE type electron transport complex subunit D [Alphaproteobacteria bacterium]